MVVLLAAAIGIMSAVFAHLIMLRLGMAQMRSYALTFLCGALVVVSITLGRTNSNWNVVTTLLLYGSWWFLFFAFVQMAESSLRVKILHILIEANGRLPREKLLQYYDEAILIEIRLARLLKSGAGGRRRSAVFGVHAT